MTEPFATKYCPKSHPVGTTFKGNRCSRKSCGQLRAAEKALNPPVRAIATVSAAEQAALKRAALVGLPEGLEGEAATEWAQKKVVALLPTAVAQIAADLHFGSDSVKSAAADKILRANGMDRKEAMADAGRPTIILNIGTDSKAPWLERMKVVK